MGDPGAPPRFHHGCCCLRHGTSCWTGFLKVTIVNVRSVTLARQDDSGRVSITKGVAMGDEFSALGALADPVRRRLYEYVAAQPDCVGREEAAQRRRRTAALGAVPPRQAGRRGAARGRAPPALGAHRSRCGTARRRSTAGPPRRSRCRCPNAATTSSGAVLAAAVEGRSQGAPARPGAQRRGTRAGDAPSGASTPARATSSTAPPEPWATRGSNPPARASELSLRNCPFDKLARAHTTLVCGVNLDFVGGVIEGLGCESVEARLQPTPDQCCVRVAQTSCSEPTTHIAKNCEPPP